MPPPRYPIGLVIGFLLGALAAGAQGPPAPAAEKAQASGLPPGLSLSAVSIRQDEKDGAIVAEGEVTIRSETGARIQADRISFRERRIVEAEGNVLVVWEGNRISGTRMHYDMGIPDDPDPDKRIARGVIEHAIGQVEPEFYFKARRVETIGEDRVVLHHAEVTTCTQPVPYWSFHVSKAKVRIDGYAHLFNLRPAIGKAPFFYLPYLLWPVKRDRAPGLLFPEFGTTSTRGRLISVPVFVPIGPSLDITMTPQWYQLAGWGLGARLRAVPNQDGYMEASTNYIWDEVSGREVQRQWVGRYRALLKQTQTFRNGFRMVSDMDIVSDFNYFTDFLRNLTYSSSPTSLGRLSFTRQGKTTSLLIQEQYREQLFAPDPFTGESPTLVQSTLPEIQWRGRSARIARSPLFLSFVSSFDNIRQFGDRIDVDYMRVDAAPTLSLPWSPRAWIDITPSIAVRSTYWTHYQGPPPPTTPPDPPARVTIFDEGLWRNLFGASLDVRGPKLFRIFEKQGAPAEDGTPGRVKKWKNTIEPRLLYTYQQAFDRSNEVIIYDEVDRFGITANTFSYGLASRLIGQRERAAPEAEGASGERILVPDGESGKLREVVSDTPDADQELAPPPPPAEPSPLEPVEIASVEIAQTYSIGNNSSIADFDGDGDLDDFSNFSAVTLTGRYNPKTYANFSFTTRYDVLFDMVSEVSLSGNFRERLARGLFSAVYRPGLGLQQRTIPDPTCPDPQDPSCPLITISEAKPDSTQLRFQGDFGPLLGRIRLGMDATYNVSPQEGEKHLPYQRWRMEYYTQCCGFLAEYLQYNYSISPRKEFRFAVDLRGIGKLFDFNQANQ
jgi:lipopolysaccharide assembly outer membrane protein LptD (OstA)